MDTFEQFNPIQKHGGLAIASFVLGLATLIFPAISVVYLIVANGGPIYFQSLFCGIPIAVISIITGIVSLLQRRKNNQVGSWMAMTGIVFGSLFFVIALFLVFVLLFPFLSGTAH